MFNTEKLVQDLAEQQNIDFDKARWQLHQQSFTRGRLFMYGFMVCMGAGVVQLLMNGLQYIWMGWVYGALLCVPFLLFYSKRVYECEFKYTITWRQLLQEIKKEISRPEGEKL